MPLRLAVFTNLTRDHLDFHGDMESYFAAKRRLFDLRKPGAPAVVNVDDPFGRRLAGQVGGRGRHVRSRRRGGATVRAESVALRPLRRFLRRGLAGGRFPDLARPCSGGSTSITSSRAAAAASLSESRPRRSRRACPAVRRVPGRLERVEAGQPYAILVDYAHTEDALRAAPLGGARADDRKIILVFGCGGDRDRGKREPMGRVAGTLRGHPDRDVRQSALRGSEAILADVERGLRGLRRNEVPAHRGPPRGDPSRDRSGQPAEPSSSSPERGTRRSRSSAIARIRSTTARSRRSSRRADELHARPDLARALGVAGPRRTSPLTGRRRRLARGAAGRPLRRPPRSARRTATTSRRTPSPGGAAAILASGLSPGLDGPGARRGRFPTRERCPLALASWLKRRAGFRLAAIAGSAGKTTTKEFAAAILSRRCRGRQDAGQPEQRDRFSRCRSSTSPRDRTGWSARWG